ncbi:MAG: dicarboxylate/amino acid:cation symporter [Planctomycetes bacterium]|nr:dicarboxylate/amino acid:cation symporter [Planctomycetota bacterium]
MKFRTWMLPAAMAAGGVAGVALGAGLGHRWTDPALEPLVLSVRLCGNVFLALLKALTIPLIALSIAMAVQELGRGRDVAALTIRTVLYFVATTFVAVVTGLVLVQLIHPGTAALTSSGAPVALPEPRSAWQAIFDLVSGMFPSNLFNAAVENNVLGLLVFSLIFGIALSKLGERAKPLVQALSIANEVLFLTVKWVVHLAPIGILGLVADRLGRAGGGAATWTEVQHLGWYSATVVAGLAFHACITLPLVLRFFARRNPFQYARGMLEALITAFGTASSAATLGVTVNGVVEKNGVSRRSADFVLPLGTTINMNGTALYEAVAVVFIAQTLGLELTGVQLAIVAITATLAAIGAAAIPEAGLVTMVLVLTAVDLPTESIGLLLAIDWILDRFRTAVNVWGDSVGAAVVDAHRPGPG